MEVGDDGNRAGACQRPRRICKSARDGESSTRGQGTREPMKIAVINDKGSAGGAGIAATRLCVGLRAAGASVTRLCRPDFPPPAESADEFIPMELAPRPLRRLWTLRRPEPVRRAMQRRWAREFERVLARLKPDVINIHNLHGAQWDIEVVAACLRAAPVIWTLHDMWAITGSCAYSFECRKFETACDRACPQIGVYPTLPRRQVAGAHAERRALFASRPKLALVAPSQWLAEEARRVAASHVPVEQLPYGLDLAVFRPRPRADAQAKLGIPDDGRPCMLAAAASLDDPRKGLATLLKALEMMRGELERHPIRLALMGRGGGFQAPPGVEIFPLGEVSGDAALSAAYAAADFFVHPAGADNQPLTVMEAIACGAPVVGLPVGGVAEMIAGGGDCGWVAANASPEGLADALRQALSVGDGARELSSRCRAHAEAHYGADRQAKAYLGLAERMLAHPAPTA